MPAATKYDQDLAIFSQLFDLSPTSADTARYIRDRAEDITRSRGAIAMLLDGVDGIPGTATTSMRSLASRTPRRHHAGQGGLSEHCRAGGIPNVVDPPFPVGFNAKDGPAGVTFSGRAFSEPRLIGLAYAFEQATHYRFPPASAPPLPSDTVIKH
jgi:amidase